MTYDQASAVPYRCCKGEVTLCLITSHGGRKWCFPKGIIDPGETPVETALKEAKEEAGVIGEISDPSLGSYKYEKWGRSLNVVVMLLKVDEVWAEWEESQVRKRRWEKPDAALKLLERAPELQHFAVKAARQLDVPLTYDCNSGDV